MEALQSITDNPLTHAELHFDGERFEGLVPLVTDEFGGIGVPEEQVLPPSLDKRSIDPLEIPDFQRVVRNDSSASTNTDTPDDPEEEGGEEEEEATDKVVVIDGVEWHSVQPACPGSEDDYELMQREIECEVYYSWVPKN